MPATKHRGMLPMKIYPKGHEATVWVESPEPLLTKETASCCLDKRLPDGRPVIGFCGDDCERRLQRQGRRR